VSGLLIPKTPVVRDKAHLVFLHLLPCCLTLREGEGVQAHHLLRTPTNERGGGRKCGDDFAIPIWHELHHQLHHSILDERDFLAGFGIYGPGLAALLYRLTGNEHACRRAISEMRESQGLEKRDD
jgi:hypothetical protein